MYCTTQTATLAERAPGTALETEGTGASSQHPCDASTATILQQQQRETDDSAVVGQHGDGGDNGDDDDDDVVCINAGGRPFMAHRSMVLKSAPPGSVLANVVLQASALRREGSHDGAPFLDVNPRYFAIVLDVMRHGTDALNGLDLAARNGVGLVAEALGLVALSAQCAIGIPSREILFAPADERVTIYIVAPHMLWANGFELCDWTSAPSITVLYHWSVEALCDALSAATGIAPYRLVAHVCRARRNGSVRPVGRLPFSHQVHSSLPVCVPSPASPIASLYVGGGGGGGGDGCDGGRPYHPVRPQYLQRHPYHQEDPRSRRASAPCAMQPSSTPEGAMPPPTSVPHHHHQQQQQQQLQQQQHMWPPTNVPIRRTSVSASVPEQVTNAGGRTAHAAAHMSYRERGGTPAVCLFVHDAHWLPQPGAYGTASGYFGGACSSTPLMVFVRRFERTPRALGRSIPLVVPGRTTSLESMLAVMKRTVGIPDTSIVHVYSEVAAGLVRPVDLVRTFGTAGVEYGDILWLEPADDALPCSSSSFSSPQSMPPSTVPSLSLASSPSSASAPPLVHDDSERMDMAAVCDYRSPDAH